MNTFERLKQVCAAVFEGEIDISAITPESSLREDIGINSIGILYMAVAIDEEFGIKFTNDDFVDIFKVSDVVAIIDKKVS